ncbi:MAG: 30S ribosomal protein S4 [Alphaproteobacteria bacterium]|nr:30S ribosomal protein S4 [Alphaproteobacteria bacterium]MBQ9739274.1 30S ribosomal protein S4 [Alphaproteobacteria bacterium]MBR6674734.1 30S ribosomal protein S4 [Alphaproteobacteria bacterium]
MSKRLSSKFKIDRRLGVNLWGKAKSPVNKRNYGPGQHGANRKKPTDYGVQLHAKQKLKGVYGNVSEKQLRKYYAEAIRRKGDTSENLIGILECRLDSVVYRMKFVSSVFAARQFVSHGHVMVNGKKVNIPSYMVKPGDEISVRNKAKEMAFVIEAGAATDREVPDYMEVDAKNFTGKFIRVPKLADVPYATQMEPNLVVEFYSR